MKLGIHSSIFPEGLNVLQKIEYTAKTGYNAIELEIGPLWASSSKPPRNVVARFLDKNDRKEILEHAKSNNARIQSLCFGMFVSPSYHIADPDPRYRDLAVSQLKETIELATDLQSEVVLIFVPETSPMQMLLNCDQKRSLVKESLLKLVRFAEDTGIIIGLEPCAPTFFVGWKDILTIINAINSDNVKCYYDVGNAVHFGLSPDEELMHLGKAITQIHIKEPNQLLENKTISFPSVGQGTMNWASIFSALTKIDYQRYLIVEHYPDPSNPYRVANESRNFLEKFLKF